VAVAVVVVFLYNRDMKARENLKAKEKKKRPTDDFRRSRRRHITGGRAFYLFSRRDGASINHSFQQASKQRDKASRQA
jgi:hypothetical protein